MKSKFQWFHTFLICKSCRKITYCHMSGWFLLRHFLVASNPQISLRRSSPLTSQPLNGLLMRHRGAKWRDLYGMRNHLERILNGSFMFISKNQKTLQVTLFTCFQSIVIILCVIQGLVNVLMFHITQLLGISSPTNTRYCDVKQIPKTGHLPTPVIVRCCFYLNLA